MGRHIFAGKVSGSRFVEHGSGITKTEQIYFARNWVMKEEVMKRRVRHIPRIPFQLDNAMLVIHG